MYAKFALRYVCVCVFIYANGLAICWSHLWQDDPHRPTTVDPVLKLLLFYSLFTLHLMHW